MEEDGIISRTIVPTVPVQVEDAVTKHGETLYPILEAMCDWGYDNIGDRYELIHPACPFEAEKA